MDPEIETIDAAPDVAEPEAEAAPAPSTRDVARAALDKQKAERGIGDNRGPAMDPEKPAVDRPRSPDGKFAPIAATDKPAPDKTANPASAAPVVAATPSPAPSGQTDAAASVRPPPGWSPAAKVAFDNLPAEVKEAVAKRETEINEGFKKLADFKGVEKYAEMARAGNTTLAAALENYTGIETLLRRDVLSGVDQVLKNVGVDPRKFVQAYAQRLGAAPQSAPQPNANQPAQPPIDPRAIADQAFQRLIAKQQADAVQGEIEKFAADPKNKFYANVETHMMKLLQAGLVGGATPAERLKNAYDTACRVDPQISALLNKPPVQDPRIAAANSARGAARATIGAPSSGVRPDATPPNANLSIRETARSALAAQRARI